MKQSCFSLLNAGKALQHECELRAWGDGDEWDRAPNDERSVSHLFLLVVLLSVMSVAWRYSSCRRVL